MPQLLEVREARARVGSSGNRSSSNLGVALRKARLLRGKTLEEASRETRIRTEYLVALETEDFSQLGGDVYARAFVRSYSTYLGLDASKVIAVFNRRFGPPQSTLPEPLEAPSRKAAGRHHPFIPNPFRNHPSWTFMVGVTVLLLSVFGAIGLLSKTAVSPKTASPGREGAAIPVLPPTVTLALDATAPVRAQVVLDGDVAFHSLLRKDEARSFEAHSRIDVRLSTGGVAVITVNGHPLGKVGTPSNPYSASFDPADFRDQTSNNAP